MVEVVAALIWEKNKFMICQRPAHKARALLWEFVGGKVEPGETKEQALIRECQEELAVTLSVGDVFMEVTHEYPDITVHLTLFNATIAEGIPRKLEHNDIRWITPAEIPDYDFCPADEEILQAIVQFSEKLLQDIACYIDRHYVNLDAIQRCLSSAAYCEGYSFEEACDCLSMEEPVYRNIRPALSLEELLRQADAGFSETLLKLIDKTGLKDSVVYKRAGLTKQHFSKIRNNPNYKPAKPTAVALALALELNLEETNDLIGRAGFTLSNSSKFDLIIRYFIEHQRFNIVEINLALYEFDQPLLGS